MKIYIYSTNNSPRLQYIVNLVCNELLGIESEVITNRDEVYSKEFVINYSNQDVVGLQIKPAKLLFEKNIIVQDLKISKTEEFVTLYQNNGAEIPFDLFSASFYFVSRYEEYIPHKRDKHNRYEPTQSVAYLNGFLDEPIVNIWAEFLQLKLKEKYPSIEFVKKSFEFLNTIDVDYAYAYKEKGFIRTLGGLGKDFFKGNLTEFSNRLRSSLGLLPDPFNTFKFILDLNKKHGFKSAFFFHVGDYDVNDKSIPIGSNKLQSLIKEVNDYAEIGLHPSYASSINPSKLGVEFSRLAKVIHQPVSCSRFHFIKVSLPESYRELIELDIKTDYTMGYASQMGFRAGICSPFKFYDLDYDASTSLVVYPFYLMEATIRYYFDEGPENALDYFKKYIDIVNRYNGTFVSLWHNDSLSEWGQWKGWSTVYEQMLAYVEQVKTNEASSK